MIRQMFTDVGVRETEGYFGDWDRSAKDQNAVVKTFLQKREEHQMTYKSGWTTKGYHISYRHNLKDTSDCKVVLAWRECNQRRLNGGKRSHVVGFRDSEKETGGRDEDVEVLNPDYGRCFEEKWFEMV